MIKNFLIGFTLLAITACANKDINTTEEFAEPQQINEQGEVYGEELSGEGSLSKTEMIADRIEFGFDSYEVSNSQKPILDNQIAYILANEQSIAKISIGGYCDQRGSIDYNMALGGKRAESIKNYMISKGVNSNIIETISYGKNIILVEGNTEEAYAKNRVGKTRICTSSNC